MRINPEFWRGIDRICWLCVTMEEFVGTNSLAQAPLLLSGMESIRNAPILEGAKLALFNLRQMSLAYITGTSLQREIALYNDHYYRHRHEKQPLYEIDAESKTLEFRRTDELEHPLITKAKAILSQPLAYRPHKFKMADPRQGMAVALGTEPTSPRIPFEPFKVPIPPRRLHDFRRVPQRKITISLEELEAIAVEMDQREENEKKPQRGNWVDRFQRFRLMVPDVGKGLQEDNKIELEGLKHLLGLPGSGKTTLLTLMAVWLSRKKYKTLLIFPSIEVARQYLVELEYHQVTAGLLFGQSPQTRQDRANRIAEAIAATGTHGGFAHTLAAADNFALNCVLPAFSNADTSRWEFHNAPCGQILQGQNRTGELQTKLCPLWTVCGRNKAPRDLIDADIWLGHITLMDIQIPPQAIDEKARYFELIARTFDVVIIDEADMVQNNLDDYGTVELSISGDKASLHQEILEQIHSRFARGENYQLFDRQIELYSRELADFGNHNTSLMTVVLNLRNTRIGRRYEDQVLTVHRLISDIADGLPEDRSLKNEQTEEQSKQEYSRSRALSEFWESAARAAFKDRNGLEQLEWKHINLCATTLTMEVSKIKSKWKRLVVHFRRYLAENLIKQRDKIIEEIEGLFIELCFPITRNLSNSREVITLLVHLTFVILSYRNIVPKTKDLQAEGLIQEPVVESILSSELRQVLTENILGSFTGIKYSLSKAESSNPHARNVQIYYVLFAGAPRILLYRLQSLFKAENQQAAPNVLLTSATSFLEDSPAYHINVAPDYLLQPPKQERQDSQGKSRYVFKWLSNSDQPDQPLFYSGGRDLRNRNLNLMVKALVENGKNCEVLKTIRNFDVQHGIYRKAAFVVNSYDQVREIKDYLKQNFPEINKRTRGIINYLKLGEKRSDFATTAQCPSLGDDENYDILIFPMMAIGRGVNIVFTDGQRKSDAAIGTIYFLTRPHPNRDDTQLFNSITGKFSQEFDSRCFQQSDSLEAISKAFQDTRKQVWTLICPLLREPLMASRLGERLFKMFTANQMVNILQTIGRGMRNGCPVQVYFIDAAWASKSARGEEDTARKSMLIQMRVILEEYINHPDPVSRAIYRELYEEFLHPLQNIEGVRYSRDTLSQLSLDQYELDEFDEDSDLWEL
jgi:hypothetical protein